MTDSPTLSAHELAALLKMTPAQFLSRRPRLQRQHGFPRVLPGLAQLWSRAQVMAWINSGGRLDGPPEPPATPAASSNVVAYQTFLQQRYAGPHHG